MSVPDTKGLGEKEPLVPAEKQENITIGAPVQDLAELDLSWEQVFKISKQFSGNSMKLKDFENKFIQLFEKNYRIYMPKDLLKKHC